MNFNCLDKLSSIELYHTIIFLSLKPTKFEKTIL